MRFQCIYFTSRMATVNYMESHKVSMFCNNQKTPKNYIFCRCGLNSDCSTQHWYSLKKKKNTQGFLNAGFSFYMLCSWSCLNMRSFWLQGLERKCLTQEERKHRLLAESSNCSLNEEQHILRTVLFIKRKRKAPGTMSGKPDSGCNALWQI